MVEIKDKILQFATKYECLDITHYLFDNYSDFFVCSASSHPNAHHYGDGGLAQHTLEVISLCLGNNKFFMSLATPADNQKLYLAALYHDVGKLYDYHKITPEENVGRPEKKKQWVSSDHKYKIHHVSRSAMIFSQAATHCRYPITFTNDVLHCILSHHGLREWGSPVQPQTREAWILHLCDSMSARVNDCLRFSESQRSR